MIQAMLRGRETPASFRNAVDAVAPLNRYRSAIWQAGVDASDAAGDATGHVAVGDGRRRRRQCATFRAGTSVSAVRPRVVSSRSQLVRITGGRLHPASVSATIQWHRRIYCDAAYSSSRVTIFNAPALDLKGNSGSRYNLQVRAMSAIDPDNQIFFNDPSLPVVDTNRNDIARGTQSASSTICITYRSRSRPAECRDASRETITVVSRSPRRNHHVSSQTRSSAGVAAIASRLVAATAPAFDALASASGLVERHAMARVATLS